MTLEEMHQFEVGGSVDDGDADVSLTCLRCTDFHEGFKVSPVATGPLVKLADIWQAADKHYEEHR